MRGRDGRSVATLTTIWVASMVVGALLSVLTSCGSDGPDATGTMDVEDRSTAPSADEAAGSSEEGDAERGRELFGATGCAGCHGAQGQGGVAPRLGGLAGTPVPLADGSTVTADDAYLLASILTPQVDLVDGYTTRMPSLVTSGTDAVDLVAFIRNLPDDAE